MRSAVCRCLLPQHCMCTVALTGTGRAALGSLDCCRFAVDGEILPSSWDGVGKTLAASGARNPNGCGLPLTWFVCSQLHGKDTGDCDVVQQAQRAGHELAVHTLTHSEE